MSLISRAALLCAALLSFVCACESRPNIIFLILDDQDLMLGSLDVMPHYTARMRDQGMEFQNAFVASPKCCPSRTSLLSGRFPHNLNAESLGWCGDFVANKRYDETFIAEVKKSGYRVGLFGKVVNDMGPMCDSSAYIPAGFNISQGDSFVAMCNEVVYYKNTFNVNGRLYTTGTSPSDYLQAYIGNQTIPWLQKAASEAASGGRPFFAYLAPHAPHFPAEPAPWYKKAPLPSHSVPRVPSYNASTDGKSWAIRENPPFDAFTADAIDRHYRNRLRSLLSVDDYVNDIFHVLEVTGTINSTFVITTSDHGYHLGNFRIPYEKSLPYDIDVRIPFFVRGPGIPGGSKSTGVIGLMDVGATILELAGAVPPGNRTTDGRSFVPLLKAAGGPTPPTWRQSTLVEFVGYPNQWMKACSVVYGIKDCPNAADVPYLIDGPQNTYSMLRVVNATHDLTYAEFRPEGSPITSTSTNWTELYDNKNDPWQGTNLAKSADLSDLKAELWRVASCSVNSCL